MSRSTPEPPQVAAPPEDPEPQQVEQGTEERSSLPAVTTEYDGERPAPRALVNPFIVLLWIIGPGLLILGVVGARELFSQQWSSNFSPEDAGAMQGMMMAAQAAVTVGLATVAGLLFWHAAAWRRIRSGS